MYIEKINKKIKVLEQKTNVKDLGDNSFFDYVMNKYDFIYNKQIEHQALFSFNNTEKIIKLYENSAKGRPSLAENNLFHSIIGYLVEKNDGIIFKIREYSGDVSLSYNDYFTKCYIIAHLIKTTNYNVNIVTSDGETMITLSII